MKVNGFDNVVNDPVAVRRALWSRVNSGIAKRPKLEEPQGNCFKCQPRDYSINLETKTRVNQPRKT